MAWPISRRRFLALAAASAVAADAAVNGAGGLAAAAARKGRFYGSAVRTPELFGDDDYRAAILRECAVITPELPLKWAAVAPRPGETLLAPVDTLVRFARSHALAVRGHALLWHRSVPDWVQARLSEAGDWSLVRAYFDAVIPRYSGAIRQWDVVNEPIDTGHRMDGLRENIFLKAFGPDYIRRALDEARRCVPHGTLMLNDFGMDYDLPVESDRRYLLLKLVERLRHAGAPLDAVGIQAHLDLGKGPFSESVFARFLADLAGLGVGIVITELDVKEHDYVLPAVERDRAVAAITRRYLDVAFAQPAVSGLVSWGLSDRYSWLPVTVEDYARYPNAWKNGDGPGLNRGLPFDAALRAKPMYDAILAAFVHAPQR